MREPFIPRIPNNTGARSVGTVQEDYELQVAITKGRRGKGVRGMKGLPLRRWGTWFVVVVVVVVVVVIVGCGLWLWW